MLDLAFVRENLSKVEEMLRRRGQDPAVLARFRETDEKRRQLITQSETLKAQRNRASEEIAKLKKAGQDASSQMAETKKLREQGEALEKQATEIDQDLRALLAGIPNVPHESVPVGNSSDDNKEVRRFGSPPNFSFTPKAHWELGEQLGVLDLERATKLSGARFAVYWDLGARMERALANFMLDLHTSQHGYTEVLPPYMVNSDSMYGTGQLPKFADEAYSVDSGELYLIPTAEVSVTNLYRDEILAADQLPIYNVAYSACFRREAGAAGRDTRGLIRVHQFEKVEMVKVVTPETSDQELDRLVANAEDVLQRLDIPYRVLLLCTGDLGFSAAKTYDLEAWYPGLGQHKEISSCSNCHDFQARRANIRFRAGPNERPEFVHSLNGSGLAVGRTLAAVIENYQQLDGSLIVPDVLRPFLGGQDVIRAR